MDFIQYGLPFAFPQQPGNIVRGIPTAHSAPPLNDIIRSDENYVWPYAKGTVRGHSIQPLYNSILKTIEADPMLYQQLALIDAVRVGKARERNIAIDLLKKSIL